MWVHQSVWCNNCLVYTDRIIHKPTKKLLFMQEILSKKMLGERIKSLRLEKLHSQAYVAKFLDLSRSNYSQIELGNQYPTFNTLFVLSKYYNKSYNWFLHGIDEVEPENPASKHVLVHDLEASLKNFAHSLNELENELQKIKKKIVMI
jgi:transcriptional regulator with XRE-family HTH domain